MKNKQNFAKKAMAYGLFIAVMPAQHMHLAFPARE
jgi:hypothetical protein